MGALTKEERAKIRDAALVAKAPCRATKYLIELAEAMRDGKIRTIRQLKGWARENYPTALDVIDEIIHSPKRPALF
jgi:hypothetical protein